MTFLPRKEPQVNYEKFRNKSFRNKKFKVGDKFVLYDGLHHIVHFFNDGGENLVVTKQWSKYKARWYYGVTPVCMMLYSICLFRDVPIEQRRKLFKLNNEEYWK